MTQMFLRTAQTEQRIETLEKQMEWVMKYLNVPPEPVLTDKKRLQTDEEWEKAVTKEGEDEPLPIRPRPAKGKSTRG